LGITESVDYVHSGNTIQNSVLTKKPIHKNDTQKLKKTTEKTATITTKKKRKKRKTKEQNTHQSQQPTSVYTNTQRKSRNVNIFTIS
jgi:hypothetical protein